MARLPKRVPSDEELLGGGPVPTARPASPPVSSEPAAAPVSMASSSPQQPVASPPARKAKPVQETLSPKQAAVPMERKRVPKRSKKLSAFDEDVLKLVKRGTRTIADIIHVLGVDAQETREHILSLQQAGLLRQDAQVPDSFSLTVKAYNEFRPRTLELSTERKTGRRKAVVPVMQPAASPQSSIRPVETVKETPQEQPSPAERASERVDLADLLERGAPKGQSASAPSNFISQPASALPSSQPTHAPTTQTAQKPLSREADAQKDVCELCKDEFRLAVKNPLPKYGHCFCGAAYHKDCYEGILDADGRCVRCGRKLDVALEKETADAMKKIRSVFDE